MAITICPECEKEISDTSATCIHCGYALAKKRSFFQVLKERKVAFILLSIVVVIVFSGGLYFIASTGMTSAERTSVKDIKTLQKTLLDPKSIILYEVYLSYEYFENEPATLIHYGARNKGGGITEDWALVSGKDVQSENMYDNALKDNDDEKILANADVVWIKTFGINSDWNEIDMAKIEKHIK